MAFCIGHSGRAQQNGLEVRIAQACGMGCVRLGEQSSNHFQQEMQIERLLHQRIHLALQCLFVLMRPGRNDDYRHELLPITHEAPHFPSVLFRHIEVQQHEMGRAGHEPQRSVPAAAGENHIVVLGFQDAADHRADGSIVVCEQNCFFHELKWLILTRLWLAIAPPQA